MQIILSPEESAAVTRAILAHTTHMRFLALEMPAEQSEWMDEQKALLLGVIERTEAAQQPIEQEGTPDATPNV